MGRVLGVSGGCLEGVWRLSDGCLRCIKMVFEDAKRMSEKCKKIWTENVFGLLIFGALNFLDTIFSKKKNRFFAYYFVWS